MPLIAQWIWHAGDPAPRNLHLQFRRPFELAQTPAAASLHISADSRYILYVNGQRLGYGPARAYHFHYEFDTYDLTPHLQAGQNVIAVDVSHFGEATFAHMTGRGGLLAQLDIDGQPFVWTDATWRTKPATAFRRNTPRVACQLPWEEQFDARLEDVGWTTIAFAGDAWEPATVIGPDGTAPWSVLSPRTIPFLTDEPHNVVRGRTLGRFKRPELVVALRAGPYLAPGDFTANKQHADGLFATVLHVPQAGPVTIQHVIVPGGETPLTVIDGVPVPWQMNWAEESAVVELSAGDHSVLLDWHCYCHDMDITYAFTGLDGLAVKSLLPGQPGTWVAAPKPNAEARAAAQAAPSIEALRACGANWEVVPADFTPPADIYAEVVYARPLERAEKAVRLPLRVTEPVAAGEAQHFLLDFGRLLMGWLEFEVEAPAGTTFDLLAYEAEQEGRPILISLINNTIRYECRDGRTKFTSHLRRGCRWLVVAVHSNSGEAIFHNATLRQSTYPWDIQGAFRSSDPRLNEIWEICAYTLRLCSEDTFTDCPTWEQAFWIGDACFTDVMLHHVVHGDPRLNRRCLLLVADSLQRVELGNKVVPGDWENDKLPNWAFMWAMGCGEYYQMTGDAAFAAEVYPALVKQAQVIENGRNAAGILDLQGYWHLLDWAKIPDGPTYTLTHESCVAVASLRATAMLGRVAGQPDPERFERLADELTAAVNAQCWQPDKQAYSDLWVNGPAGNTSQPTNIAAVLTGVAPAEREAAVMPHLLYGPEDWITTGSPWMTAWACMLHAQRGNVTPVLDTIRDRWGTMLDNGAVTTWEIFPGFEVMREWWTRSWCHAWSAFPGYVLSVYVLGIRPLTPGFGEALIEPQLGDLQWVEGRMPTPHGPIAARVERTATGALRLDVTLPEVVPAKVKLPAGSAKPKVVGRRAKVTREGDQYVVNLPAGAQVVINA